MNKSFDWLIRWFHEYFDYEIECCCLHSQHIGIDKQTQFFEHFSYLVSKFEKLALADELII